ncbi:FeMo cofactor biosynthesis domain protein [Fibrobacter succinogenes subsp. succinogenes S85]|jgi:nitrogen fixation protein NifB|uniref:Dinitrogenase iron-molybdenum cofactor biosynthesis protein n=1 Tax=Fibrobacter succinogenes (strain ATCC 19169 / S85) TaxID=59374 RepID=C9RQ17_FIBSS|nr:MULTISPECIES: NifB/NifX family molybdenum-iron cluster-binding protein [Fibrobacter]ACX74694.1 Dinitrogenase iron-molybdenum cofactor biosynthesis protein [Fibrobacter succinogenes subsp. succinogenes S85]ADL26429.1 FeMo cofactor biosynthesis domain protein [Fibrobacter succinogenes subsp. succinogenes S85]MBQ2559989.1 dinitrogenase iron-molybdenum cofactor biosynthesis protein [Fibrobacter sp.]MBQ3777428.1 dinitrogenase iron-molybdenum cofactor biosynthesis protein [Fibrobacter sp.]MBQ7081
MAKYKVAVATNDGVNVNVHFGHAAAFDIYEVDEASGKYEKVEVRLKPEHCDGSCGDGTCGQREVQHSSMYAAAKNLADLDYVLCEQLGPQAIQSLARFNVRAFDIALPISEAIAKINIYRNKIAERALRFKSNHND